MRKLAEMPSLCRRNSWSYGKNHNDNNKQSQLSDEERLDIFEFHLPNRWQNAVCALGFDPLENTLADLIDQAKCQEIIEARTGHPNRAQNSSPTATKKGRRTSKKQAMAKPIVSPQTQTACESKFCFIHGHCAHDSNQCTTLKAQAGKMKAAYQAQGDRCDQNCFKKAQEANQINQVKAALESLLMKPSSKKRKMDAPAEDDNDEVNALEECIEGNFECAAIMKKKQMHEKM